VFGILLHKAAQFSIPQVHAALSGRLTVQLAIADCGESLSLQAIAFLLANVDLSWVISFNIVRPCRISGG
jgi:hypothetical protein